MTRLVDIQSITDGGSNVVTIGTDLALNGSNVALAPDLASTANAEGASLIGVEDAGALFTATDVEGVLAEIQGNVTAAISDDIHYATTTVTFDGGATQSIGTIPLNAIVTECRIYVDTTFDGTGFSFTVGNIGQGTSVLADSDDFDLTAGTTVQQKLNWFTNDSASNDWSVFLTAGTATQGSFDIIFFYTQP